MEKTFVFIAGRKREIDVLSPPVSSHLLAHQTSPHVIATGTGCQHHAIACEGLPLPGARSDPASSCNCVDCVVHNLPPSFGTEGGKRKEQRIFLLFGSTLFTPESKVLRTSLSTYLVANRYCSQIVMQSVRNSLLRHAISKLSVPKRKKWRFRPHLTCHVPSYYALINNERNSPCQRR